ncbi:single-stranded DNA-binding protein [Enterococcus cecorum]|uniref:single-stranded DNA-binding protein n=1 Tax=Enterococcus cecorum TaxID=44008 RepID=UPI003264C1C0
MINSVSLTGRLIREVDLRYSKTGKPVAQFTLAVNRKYPAQNGERQADFIRCIIWGKSAEALEKYTQKGSLIGVEGRIQTRNYTNSQGKRVYLTEVVAQDFVFLESKGTAESRNGAGIATDYEDDLPDLDMGVEEFSDDDLPF